MTPRWGMLIRGTPRARIRNHRIRNHRPTKQGVKPVSEGKDARVAGASVAHAAIRYRNAAKAVRKRGREPPQGRGGAGPGRNPAQRGRGVASALAEMAGLPGGDAPAGCTHPAGAKPHGGGVPGLQALRFRREPGKPVPHPGRRDPEGGGAAAEEGLHVHSMAEDPGNRGGNRTSGVMREPPKPEIPGLRSSP